MTKIYNTGNATKEYTLEIEERYIRRVKVKADSMEEAVEYLEEEINKGTIDIPCDGDGYRYDSHIYMV